jgi:hypothetical protein
MPEKASVTAFKEALCGNNITLARTKRGSDFSSREQSVGESQLLMGYSDNF